MTDLGFSSQRITFLLLDENETCRDESSLYSGIIFIIIIIKIFN